MLVYQRSGGYLGDGNPDLLGMGGQGRQHRSQGQERSAAPIEIGILTESQGFHKNFSTKKAIRVMEKCGFMEHDKLSDCFTDNG